jgi:HD superfamily phosphohydrolase
MTSFANSLAYLRPPRRGFGLYYDPLYGYIPLSPIVRQALDLPSMQRLRHIKQLSTVYFVFPGATHSRFEHSVGVHYLADKVYDVLHTKKEQFNRVWPEFDPIYRIALNLASLFHDVGHGPWSHVFELFCGMKEDYRRLKHHKITKEWIYKGYGGFTDIPPFINIMREGVKKRFKAIIPKEDWGRIEDHIEKVLTVENIAKIAVGEPPSDKKYTFLSNIVSSVFDVDRMDYLRRDALHTGIETGRVDIWEILHSYTLFEENGKWIAGLSAQSATAVEALLVIRDLAYRKVYYHPVHRCAQEMMIRGMCEIVDKYGVDALATMTDEELLRAFDEGDAFTKDVAQRIRLRAPYAALPFTTNVSMDLDSQAKSKWAGLTFTQPEHDKIVEKWLQHEKTSAKKIGLPNDRRIIDLLRNNLAKL